LHSITDEAESHMVAKKINLRNSATDFIKGGQKNNSLLLKKYRKSPTH
jgi:hypothetical protein